MALAMATLGGSSNTTLCIACTLVLTLVEERALDADQSSAVCDLLDAQFQALGISAGFTSLLIVVSAVSTVLRTLQAMTTVPRLFKTIDREAGRA